MSYFTINRVVLVGRLTRDAEIRTLPSGTSVCGLRIACNTSRRDAETGEPRERPNYFDVSIYGAAADSVGRFTRKGSRVGVDGRLEWREWETDGQRRQAVSIVADTVQFLDSPGGGRAEEGSAAHGDGGDAEDDRELAGVGAEQGEVSF